MPAAIRSPLYSNSAFGWTFKPCKPPSKGCQINPFQATICGFGSSLCPDATNLPRYEDNTYVEKKVGPRSCQEVPSHCRTVEVSVATSFSSKTNRSCKTPVNECGSGCQAEPFHRAMRKAFTLPAIVNSPAAIKSPLNTARASTVLFIP